ncbi:hypothetical protein GCM10010246_17950 [Streptomyces cuspidosporus]|uniref:Uncharacterized protein n=1 Tax=Streptomyces cuspidosporus TaxID=66882 RepID=A0ABP5SQ73_9ACTN
MHMVAQIASIGPVPAFAPILVVGPVADDDERARLPVHVAQQRSQAQPGHPALLRRSWRHGVLRGV